MQMHNYRITITGPVTILFCPVDGIDRNRQRAVFCKQGHVARRLFAFNAAGPQNRIRVPQRCHKQLLH
jgi:hypothetical protein